MIDITHKDVVESQILEIYGYEFVKVVRCKDCRFHEQEQPGMVYCPAVVGGWVDDDWFCADGERRDPCSSQDS